MPEMEYERYLNKNTISCLASPIKSLLFSDTTFFGQVIPEMGTLIIHTISLIQEFLTFASSCKMCSFIQAFLTSIPCKIKIINFIHDFINLLDISFYVKLKKKRR